MTPEDLLRALVAFLLGLLSGGFVVHYRERLIGRNLQVSQRNALRAELNANLARLRRHRDEQWPTELSRAAWTEAQALKLRTSARTALDQAYAAVDDYNLLRAQEYKLSTGHRTADFMSATAARVDPLPVERAVARALAELGGQ